MYTSFQTLWVATTIIITIAPGIMLKPDKLEIHKTSLKIKKIWNDCTRVCGAQAYRCQTLVGVGYTMIGQSVFKGQDLAKGQLLNSKFKSALSCFGTHTHETSMLRYRQISKSYPSLPPDGIRFLSHIHTLSLCWEAEMSYGQLIIQWEARWEEREGWWKDELVKPFCSLHCVQAQWQTTLYRVLSAAYCASFFVNLGQLRTFSLTTISISLTLYSLPSSSDPLLSLLSDYFIFSYPVSIFHSVCTSHLHTESLWESMLHPDPPPNVTTL